MRVCNALCKITSRLFSLYMDSPPPLSLSHIRVPSMLLTGCCCCLSVCVVSSLCVVVEVGMDGGADYHNGPGGEPHEDDMESQSGSSTRGEYGPAKSTVNTGGGDYEANAHR